MEENMRRDPYEVLGVSRNATKAEIRKAYHRLALRHHPDKCNGDADAKAAATKKFAEIGAAYETLTNPEAAAAVGGGGRGEGPMYDDYAAGGAPFGHPFFQSRPGPFPSAFPASSVFGSMFHETDPFMMGMGGGGSPFFHFTDPFELFERTFGKMGLDVDDDDGFFGIPSAIPPGGGGFATVSFSSSSMVPDPSTGSMKTISTSTQVVNGRRTTKTETTVIHPDGRRETFVEIDGGDGAGPNSVPPRLSERAHGETLLTSADGSPLAPRRVEAAAHVATPPRTESHKRSYDEMASARQRKSHHRAEEPQAELQRRDGRLGTPENGVGQNASCPRVYVGEKDEDDVIDLTNDGGVGNALPMPMSPIVSPTDHEIHHDDDGASGEGSTTEGPSRKHPSHGYEEGLLPDFGHTVSGCWPTQQNHDGRDGNLADVMPRAGIGDDDGSNTFFPAGGMQGTKDRLVEAGDTAESSPQGVFDQGNAARMVPLEGGVQHPSRVTGFSQAGESSMPVAMMNGVQPLSQTAMPPGGQSANFASEKESYYSLTVPFLKEKLRERGLTVSGRKAELIERLLKSEGKQS